MQKCFLIQSNAKVTQKANEITTTPSSFLSDDFNKNVITNTKFGVLVSIIFSPPTMTPNFTPKVILYIII